MEFSDVEDVDSNKLTSRSIPTVLLLPLEKSDSYNAAEFSPALDSEEFELLISRTNELSPVDRDWGGRGGGGVGGMGVVKEDLQDALLEESVDNMGDCKKAFETDSN